MYTSKQLHSVAFCYILVHTITYIYNYMHTSTYNYLHAITLHCMPSPYLALPYLTCIRSIKPAYLPTCTLSLLSGMSLL